MSSPGDSVANVDQAEYWNSDEGAFWVDAQARYDEMLAPFVSPVLAAAAPASETAVLDVGCGTGATTLAAARAARRATGIDISRPMIDAALRRAVAEDVDNVDFAVADAQVATLAPTTDVIVSRFGVMFFADPVAAFANLRRALTPGGRLAFVCWQPLLANEWMTVPAIAVAEHVPLPTPADPTAPGPFAFGDPEYVRSVLESAGYRDVAVDPFSTSILLGGRGSVDDAVTFLRNTGMGRMLLADATTEAVRDALDAVREALEPHVDADGVRLGAATWIVIATT